MNKKIIIMLLFLLLQHNLFGKKEINYVAPSKAKTTHQLGILKMVKALGAGFGIAICMYINVSVLYWVDCGHTENTVHALMFYIEDFIRGRINIEDNLIRRAFASLFIVPPISLVGIYLTKFASKNLTSSVKKQ